jgi:hypothetical protein
MDLKKFLECFDYKISGGSEYQWKCFGDNARFMDFESEHAHGSIIFDTVNQTVYCSEVSTKEEKYQYRWLNPDFINSYRQEAIEKNIDPDIAWDNTKWTNLEVEEDFFEKANAIFNNKDFDTSIAVTLDLPDDLLLKAALNAHNKGITLNDYINEALAMLVAEYKQDPEGFKDKMDKLLSTKSTY